MTLSVLDKRTLTLSVLNKRTLTLLVLDKRTLTLSVLNKRTLTLSVLDKRTLTLPGMLPTDANTGTTEELHYLTQLVHLHTIGRRKVTDPV